MNDLGALSAVVLWLIAASAVILVVAIAIIASLALKRHREATAPQPGWERTEEVFKDPSTARVMRVWIEPASGKRHYVPESAS